MLIGLLVLLLGMPLIGYLWPLSSSTIAIAPVDDWTWPSATQPRAAVSAPDKLAVYWPGKAPGNAESDSAAGDASKRVGAKHAWQLIGIIRQGGSLNALVMDPQQNILVLKAGDALDSQRRVSLIEATRLHWQSPEGQTGVLTLYPQSSSSDAQTPEVGQAIPAASPQATAIIETAE